MAWNLSSMAVHQLSSLKQPLSLALSHTCKLQRKNVLNIHRQYACSSQFTGLVCWNHSYSRHRLKHPVADKINSRTFVSCSRHPGTHRKIELNQDSLNRTFSQEHSVASRFHDAAATPSSHSSQASFQNVFSKYPIHFHKRNYHKLWSSSKNSPASSTHPLLNNHHPLLSKSEDSFQSSYHQPRAFSIARSILDSSPSGLQPYLRLIRFDKPIGTWLLYWPCTWSIALAAQSGCLPDFKMLALFGAGAFFMRSAGCIINDMWDKDFDSRVARTRERPLASGELSYFQALVFLGCQLSISLSILLQLNWYTVILGASSMGLVITYPLAKRFTYWPQIVLGLTLNVGVLLAWSGIQGELHMPALLLYGACTFYTVIYDTIYSHQDKYDDMLIGVKSTALRLGEQTKPWLTGFTAIMTGGLVSSGLLLNMPWPYYLGVGLTAGRLLQQISTTDLDNAEQCGRAFRGNFYLGIVMFAGIVLANLMKPKQEQNEADEMQDQDVILQ